MLLGALVAGVAHGSIQDKLTAKANAALDAKGIDATDVKFSGRDGTLALPTGADASAAKAAVAGVDGVRTVDVADGGSGGSAAANATGDAAAPYSVINDGKSFTVTATVPNDAAKGKLIAEVTKAVAPTPVVDMVTIKAGAVAPAAGTLGGVAAAMAKAPGVAATWDGSALTLDGKVADDATKQSINQAAAAAGTVDDQLTVSPTGSSTGGSSGTDNAAACSGLNDKLAAAQKGDKIEFTPGSAAMTASSVKAVNTVATLLKGCATANVEVGGYTDNQGSKATSQPLSQRRADAVRAALLKLGVPAKRVTAKGYGESNPIASNATDAGRAANRRVEITVK